MARIPLILIGFAVCVLLPAAALSQKVTYDNYRAKDLSHLKTYAFKAAAPEDSTLEKGSTYDDPFVVLQKARYIRHERLGGAMVWSLDGDDAHATLTRTIRFGLGR